MITIEKVGDAIRFTFVGNDHYLNEGTIEVPINSLSLVTDDSGMATFKKSSSNDVFVSATYQELGMTKAELEEFYKENMIGKVGSEITPEEVEEMIDEAVSGKLDTSAITTEITSASTDSQVPSAKLMYDVIDEIEDVTATALNSLNERLDEKQDQLIAGSGITISGNVISATGGGITSGEVQDMIDESISGKVDTSAITSSVTSASTDSEVPTAKAVYDSISGKQDTILGLWSEAPYRSVSIGYDNSNTVKCDSSLAVGDSNTIGSGTRSSIAVGEHNTVGGYLTRLGMYVFGGYCNATNNYSLANGYYVNTDNLYEAGFGTYNKTTFDYRKPFGDSGNTLFSVGNGTANNARHNAFEIKQNGDIYISKDGQDVKLQDQLGGGGGGGGLDDDTQLLLSTALTDLNDRKADLSEVRQNYQRKGDYATKSELAAKANVSDVMTLEKAKENEQVTSYALNNLNNRVTDNTTALGGMKLVKITESEYAALTTKDENTLYVVVADPE